MPQQYWQAESVLQDLLGADSVLPEQFYRPDGDTARLSGERALMWAVFADGLETYRRNAPQATRQQRANFSEAESWIRANDWSWVFSFVNLCEMFGFEPAAVRLALRRWRLQYGSEPARRQRFRPVGLRAAA
ncbi:MAG: hypothetical protein HY699_06995 [Deltaproteobacteria bacterium]|nr:hypothetical protein [Deltaproteobacteria bacterium]